mgnify:CR=1 FL=1
MTITRRFLSALAISSLVAMTSLVAQEAAPSANRALVNKYCATCHNERLRTAELELREAPKFDFRIESRSREEDFAALLAIIDRVRPTRT